MKFRNLFIYPLLSVAVLFANPSFASPMPQVYTTSGNMQTWTFSGAEYIKSNEKAIAWAVLGATLVATLPVSATVASGAVISSTLARTVAVDGLWAAAMRVAGGPVGLAALIGLPAFAAWVASDNATNVRINPAGTGLEKRGGADCASLLNFQACQMFITNGAYGIPGQGSCVSVPDGPGYCLMELLGASPDYPVVKLQRAGGAVGDWVPATMLEAGPYMSPRPPPASYPAQIFALDPSATFPVSSATFTPLTADPSPSVYSESVDYPQRPDLTSTTSSFGNIYNLPDALDHNIDIINGNIAVDPGFITVSGTRPVDLLMPAPLALQLPSTTTKTASYNPTSGKTTVVAATHTPGATKTTTVTSNAKTVDSVVVGPAVGDSGSSVVVPALTPTSVVSGSRSTTVTTTSADGTTISTSTVTDAAVTPPAAAADPCVTTPGRLGCLSVGALATPDVLPKTTSPVAMVATAFAGGGGCPVPLPFVVYGHSYALSYQPLCDKLIILKFIFMALAGVAAAYILADSFRIQ